MKLCQIQSLKRSVSKALSDVYASKSVNNTNETCLGTSLSNGTNLVPTLKSNSRPVRDAVKDNTS